MHTLNGKTGCRQVFAGCTGGGCAAFFLCCPVYLRTRHTALFQQGCIVTDLLLKSGPMQVVRFQDMGVRVEVGLTAFP